MRRVFLMRIAIITGNIEAPICLPSISGWLSLAASFAFLMLGREYFDAQTSHSYRNPFLAYARLRDYAARARRRR